MLQRVIAYTLQALRGVSKIFYNHYLNHALAFYLALNLYILFCSFNSFNCSDIYLFSILFVYFSPITKKLHIILELTTKEFPNENSRQFSLYPKFKTYQTIT